jgi:uncharacterized membrane protein
MNKIFFKVAILSLFAAVIGLHQTAFARENVTEWYMKDFKSEIVLNADSTAQITEEITADIGTVPGKHGIFRVLPTQIKTPTKTYETPVKLLSITDFNGRGIPYAESYDSFNHTVTWKIGDPGINVSGGNHYKIVYLYKNVVRFDSPDFDEFYWNLNGNFWDMEADSFTGRIIFPVGVNKQNTEISYYTGDLKSKDTSLAKYEWESDNTLKFTSTRTLAKNEGITVSVTFPKNIFTPYKFSATDTNGTNGWVLKDWYWPIFPLLTFIICFLFWYRYGREEKFDKTPMPEFTVPDDLSPMSLKMVSTIGNWQQDIITVGIISLATKGIIKITEKNKWSIWQPQNYEFENLENSEGIGRLDPGEKKLFDVIFKYGKKTVSLSELSLNFSMDRKGLILAIQDFLVQNGYLTETGLKMQKRFGITSLVVTVCFIILILVVSSRLEMPAPDSINFIVYVLFSGITSTLIIGSFAYFMSKRTAKGNEANWHAENLKMYMQTAEKDRMKFYEKENIFEKFLPYAIAFGITDIWVKKMRELYGDEYFNNYHPVWYSGIGVSTFSADSFASALNSISSNIASNVGSSSGHGGSGGSGGGGGGGGGGGW